MNDEDIKQFISTFEDFMNHADVEMQNYIRYESARKYTKSFFEKEAKRLNVSVDYYIQEFV